MPEWGGTNSIRAATTEEVGSAAKPPPSRLDTKSDYAPGTDTLLVAASSTLAWTRMFASHDSLLHRSRGTGDTLRIQHKINIPLLIELDGLRQIDHRQGHILLRPGRRNAVQA